MLKMIVGASSNPGDVVLDCFAGSGTTLGAAYELDRKWIGVDNSPESIKAIFKRFVSGLEVYGDYVNDNAIMQMTLNTDIKAPFDVWTTEENYICFDNLNLPEEALNII